MMLKVLLFIVTLASANIVQARVPDGLNGIFPIQSEVGFYDGFDVSERRCRLSYSNKSITLNASITVFNDEDQPIATSKFVLDDKEGLQLYRLENEYIYVVSGDPEDLPSLAQIAKGVPAPRRKVLMIQKIAGGEILRVHIAEFLYRPELSGFKKYAEESCEVIPFASF